ncbi:YcnI family protein [Paenibacillus physcomitrellae]|uniref:YncI copper-binding domain-containing protein n=1 Tax=Paenibacillus physcomitrellae TaxID=1619311 RepID=A0ABQ1FUF2_9BACL|nr:DUF1775 domain-containing protein [Paenibacillus physcomitrellae]GGA31108.1 hypothetical protein GCM10010917_15230 [Paenibacillus physcomitrellae]
MSLKKSLRFASILSTALTGALLFAGIASAHVTVKPTESAPGAWETYTMKVPTEKDLPTVKVALKVPEQAELEQYQPVPGWKTTTNKDDSGKIKTITWEAESGNGIEPGQFQQFSFVVKNPAADGDLAWDAFQYYSDDSVVEWTGEEGADTPHSITKITSAAGGAAAADAGHGHDAAAGNASGAAAAGDNTSANAGTDTAATASSSSSSVMQTVTLIITIVALLVSLAALWFAVQNGRRKA